MDNCSITRKYPGVGEASLPYEFLHHNADYVRKVFRPAAAMGSVCHLSRNRILQKASAMSVFISLSLFLTSVFNLFVFLAKCYYDGQTKDAGMGGACNTSNQYKQTYSLKISNE